MSSLAAQGNPNYLDLQRVIEHPQGVDYSVFENGYQIYRRNESTQVLDGVEVQESECKYGLSLCRLIVRIPYGESRGI